MFLTFAFLTERFVFGKRCDKNPKLKYFSAEDFNLSAEPVFLPKGLKGFLYGKGDIPHNGKLIIFCHGMGPGHIAYTTEIAYFCNKSYNVLAVDSTGCGFSDGKKIKGMYEGVKTAISAIDYAKSLKFEKIYLVGHSWGAYSALCASKRRKVDKVVAISAPNTPSKTMQEGAAPIISRPLAAIERPFWWLVNLFKYGAKGNSNAAKCAEKNDTPTLLIHGDIDRVVTPKKAVFFRADGENITKLLEKGKAHNPYNTANAEKLLAELSAKLKKNDIADISTFDFKGATEEDEEVMKRILNFLAN